MNIRPPCADRLSAGAGLYASANKPGIDEQPGSAVVVQGVTGSIGGIGDRGIGCMAKPIALKRADGSASIAANAASSVSLTNQQSRRRCVELKRSLHVRSLPPRVALGSRELPGL